MTYRGRRVLDRFFLVGAAVVLAAAAALASAIGDGERISRYRAQATVTDSGSADIAEVIDYDFGASDRRGIFRDVPDLALDADIVVRSDTAPDQVSVEPGAAVTRIRIGDPDVTISGRHRYEISYPISVTFEDGFISWNAVGDQWPVAIADVELELLTQNELTDLQCSKGDFGTWDGCTVTQPEPGRLIAAIDGLGSNEGVTISARPGPELGQIPAGALSLTDDPLTDPGAGVLAPMLLAGLVGLWAAVGVSAMVRQRGKELVWAGGSADAAFGPQYGETFGVRAVDHEELAELATTEFAPPKELNAWQGGILHREGVSGDTRSAWLLERAIAGEIEIGGTDDLTLHLQPVDSPERDVLNAMFAGRTTVELGKYDKQFAAGWATLEKRLKRWYDESPYWDPEGERRRGRVLGWGFLPLALGLIITVVFAFVSARLGLTWLAGVALGAAFFGAGFAMVARSWELRIRTPQGSGLWILVESFRRFIEQSDAQHVQAAAERGQLRDYSAWAVSLGEADRWAKSIEAANAENPGSYDNDSIRYARVAPLLGAAVTSTSTAPSSKGSSGGGGSVGGGGGGGGGGSW